MFNTLIKFILILLIVFTPIFFGSVELWAFSLMELGILLIIILWSVQGFRRKAIQPSAFSFQPSALSLEPATTSSHLQSSIPIVLLLLFLCVILFQILPLPSGLVKIISPKTYELRHALQLSPLSIEPSALSFQPSAFGLQPSALSYPISFFPYATQIEFFKWLTLGALFFFLLRWKLLDHSYRTTRQLIIVIMLVGMGESLYGMFEFFSGYHQILYLENSSLVSSVTGTFVNPNFFAGYLLMVIPLSVGYLLSREANRGARFTGWRNRLSALDGKTLLIGFGIIVMILGFLFSASRMGILSLLLSFSLITLFFRNPQKGQRFSKTSVLIFTLAFLWAAWIGLDAVIGRFFTVSEDFKWRWMVWVNTFQTFKDFPLLGSGLGTFERVFPIYQSFYGLEIVDHAENDFLQIVSETGLVGAGLLLTPFLILFHRAVSGIRSLSHGEPRRYIGIGAMIGIVGLMLHSLVETNIQIPSNAFLYTFLFAIVLRVSKSETKSLSH